MVDVAVPLRCSPSIRALGVDPIGSAATRTSFLLVDHPLPWPKEVSDAPEAAPIVAAMRALGSPWRLQAVVPDDGSSTRRIVRYSLPDGPFTRYERREVVVDPGDVVEAAVALLAEPAAAEPAAGEPDARADLLVCTHGRRDTCCGASGTTLWLDLLGRAGLLPPAVRVCRTSHTGGHRFAPTTIDLPSGACWAWIDAEMIGHIERRDVAFAEVAAHYRGSCALATVEEQVVERAVLEQVGWGWFDLPRAGEVVARDGKVASVELTDHGDGGGTWSAATVVVGTSPVPTCPGFLDEAPKQAKVVELVAGSLHFTARRS